MRIARSSGGTIEKAVTRFDHKRDCRVLELIVTWPLLTGYDEVVPKVHIDGTRGVEASS